MSDTLCLSQRLQGEGHAPDLTPLPVCKRDSVEGWRGTTHRARAALDGRGDPEGGSPHRASFRPVSTLSIRGANTPGVSSRNISGRSHTCGHRGQRAHHSGSVKRPPHQAFCWTAPQAVDPQEPAPMGSFSQALGFPTGIHSHLSGDNSKSPHGPIFSSREEEKAETLNCG